MDKVTTLTEKQIADLRAEYTAVVNDRDKWKREALHHAQWHSYYKQRTVDVEAKLRLHDGVVSTLEEGLDDNGNLIPGAPRTTTTFMDSGAIRIWKDGSYITMDPSKWYELAKLAGVKNG